jgi:hypothetical protein
MPAEVEHRSSKFLAASDSLGLIDWVIRDCNGNRRPAKLKRMSQDLIIGSLKTSRY